MQTQSGEAMKHLINLFRRRKPESQARVKIYIQLYRRFIEFC